jgi:hypothetical protein
MYLIITAAGTKMKNKSVEMRKGLVAYDQRFQLVLHHS